MNITDKINELNKKLFIDLEKTASDDVGNLKLVGEKVEVVVNTWGKDLAEVTDMECGPPQFKVRLDTGSDQPLKIEPANDIAREIFDINDVLGLQEDS